MFEKIYRTDENGIQKKISMKDLQIMANQETVSDLNLIYKSNTKTAYAAFRLTSWISDQPKNRGERVTKFLVEIGTYDASKPKGSRQKENIKIFLDDDDFSYFCEMLKSGRILDRLERGDKVPYEVHNGKGDAKRLRIFKGSKLPIILEAAQGPGKEGSNGQTLPDDWQGKNKDLVRKSLIGLSCEEAFKIGLAGARALQILDMWRAFGRDSENLALINIRKKNDADRYQDAQRRQGGNYSDDYYRGPAREAGYSARSQRNDYYDNGFGYAQ